jgi:ABC-type nitrate/sulfonate/bicarbonate transport system substrate-binding protein
MERVELEQRGFPVLFDIGKVLPKFPFVVIVTSRRKAETDPEGITAVMRAMKRSMESIRADREKVTSAILKRGSFGDPGIVKKVINHFADLYSISITKEDIEALIAAAKLEAEAKKLGGAERFYIASILAKALGQSR